MVVKEERQEALSFSLCSAILCALHQEPSSSHLMFVLFKYTAEAAGIGHIALPGSLDCNFWLLSAHGVCKV